jgi:carotenoid cleavage dioxygenase-like enzyme
MTKEDGRPYRVDPKTLDTFGSYDFGGKLKSETMTAHVRIDPETGEMFFYGYEADGLASNKVAYCIADKHGNLVSEQWFDAPYCAMMHDFTISENYALFPIYPTKADLDRIKAGGDHWAHQMDEDSWLGVMPRYGDVSEMRWFKGPRGVYSYHMMNAHDDGNGVLHFDQCLADCNAFPFIQKASGITIAPQDMNGRLARWTVDMKSDATEITETVIGPPGDFPVIPAAEQGRPYSRAWMLTMNPDLQGPPLPGGPVGVMFNMLLRLDWPQGVTQALPLPPLACYNEPVHVPSATPGHDGWLVTVVTSQAGENDYASEVWVIDGGNLGAGPVAKAAIPHRLRPQVHGWWVNATQLSQAI